MSSLSSPKIEQRFYQCFGVDAFGRMQAQRVMDPYRRAREQLLRTTTTAAAAAAPATVSANTALSLFPCWSFFRDRLPAAPRDETLKDLLRLGGVRWCLNPGDAATSLQVTETEQWSPSELEYRHDYIQWLFPLRETGVNPYAALLTDRDVLQLRADGVAMASVLCAFSVMLRFYGMRMTLSHAPAPPSSASSASSLQSDQSEPAESRRERGQLNATGDPTASHSLDQFYTATFCRSPHREEQAAQYLNLCRHGHNYLRISRILQFLGEVGLEPLKVGWLRFLAREVLVPDCLVHEASEGEAAGPMPPLAPCEASLATFWIETPYDAQVREKLKADALELLAQVDAVLGSDQATAKRALPWAVRGRGGKGPVVRTAPFSLPADTPVQALPFFVKVASTSPCAERPGASAARSPSRLKRARNS